MIYWLICLAMMVLGAGCNTSQANQGVMNVAIKELADRAEDAAKALLEHGGPFVPSSFLPVNCARDSKDLKRVQLCGMRHAVLHVAADSVFHRFRLDKLTAEPFGSDDCRMDEDTQRAVLRLERWRAERWLKMVTSLNAPAPQLQQQVAELTEIAVKQLLKDVELVDWNDYVNTLPDDDFKEIMAPVIKAALKAQVVVNAMHSRLLYIWVPGWLPSQEALPALAGTSHAGKELVFDKMYMTSNLTLPVHQRQAPQGSGKEFAIFCQEPAVLQLAQRVDALPGFGGDPAALGSPVALKKAKVCTARL